MSFASRTPRTARSSAGSNSLVVQSVKRGRTPAGRPPSRSALLDASRRAKMEALRRREDEKGDRRRKLESLLTKKLVAKYANGADPESHNAIANAVSSFMCSTAKVTERQLLKLEQRVKAQATERALAAQAASAATPRLTSSRRPSARQPSARQDASEAAAEGGAGAGAGAAAPAASRAGEEWVMMAMYNKLQYEDEQARLAKTRAKEQADTRARFKESLDELQRQEDAERAEMMAYHAQQQKELEWWKQEEAKKEAAIKQKHMHEKEVRLQQIREKQARLEKVTAKKAVQDQAEIKRCVDALRKEEELAAAAKQRERAYLRSVLLENEKTRKARESLWKNEADEDVRLMREYASRLDAQDAARAKAFEDKIRTSASNEEMTHKLKAAERERERKMDENIARYTKEREDREDARGLAEMAKRTNDRVAFKKTLDEQIQLQESLKAKERQEERKYADLYRRDGEQAKKDELVVKQKMFQKKLETQKLFLDQIEDKKRRGITAESLENMGMSTAETLFNKQMMDTIRNTPGMVARIQQTLKGGKAGAPVEQADISNVF